MSVSERVIESDWELLLRSDFPLMAGLSIYGIS